MPLSIGEGPAGATDRQVCDLRPAKKPKRLPRVLNADGFRQFYRVVDQADNVQHFTISVRRPRSALFQQKKSC